MVTTVRVSEFPSRNPTERLGLQGRMMWERIFQ